MTSAISTTILAIVVFFHAYQINVDSNNLRIIKTDSVRNLYVFTLDSRDSTYKYVIAEKDSIRDCICNAQFINKDSIKETVGVKIGNKITYIGFNSLTVDGVRIKDKGYLAKVITNCKSVGNSE